MMSAQFTWDSRSFVAPTDWNGQRPGALVICCSDGRWHTQVEEFIRTCVSDRPDLYIVPGGPAGLSTWSSSFNEVDAATKSFRFLAEQHQLTTVWLIAHSDCAYYRSKYYPHDTTSIARQQLQDMKRAAESIGRDYPTIQVHQVYARLDGTKVLFESVGARIPRDRPFYDQMPYS